MIELQSLAQKLTDMLNGDFDSEYNEYQFVHAFGLDAVLPNTTYRFCVAADEGGFKRNHLDDLNPNQEIRYINAILTVSNSSNEGINIEDYVGTMETTLDVIVPDLYIVDESGVSILPKRVRQLLTDVLQYNQSSMQTVAQVIGETSTDYLVGIDYNIATTGTAQIRHQVGESLTMSVYIDFTFVSNGIASSAIRLYFKNDNNQNVRIYAAQLGIARKCTLESNTGTESGKNAVTNEVDNTVLTINGNLAVRNSSFCGRAFDYVVNELISPLVITVEICATPTSSPIASNTFNMIFSECGLNSEPPYAASMSFVLVEAPEEV